VQIAALEKANMPLAPEHALAVLMARDVVQTALPDRTQASMESVLTLTRLDNCLKQHAAAITQVISLADLRDCFRPPSESWWWFLSPPTLPQRWDRYDWLWNTLSVICLAMALSLVVDISGRFLGGGPDTLGAFAVIGQSLLTMLAAGGALTQAGREVSGRILTSLRLPQYFWAEVQLSFAVLLLVGAILFSNALPWIASLYNNHGVEHYRAGRLGSAESAFKRALKLNPDAAGAHYNLGRLYEVLEENDQAQTEYKAALKGGLDAAYNNLARLYLLKKQYVEAEPLLLAGLDHALDDNVKYSILKNLGWARWGLKDYAGAEDVLRRAIDLQPDKAPAHCLLAQVFEAQEEKQQEQQEEWKQCSRWCTPRHSPEEGEWCAKADRQRTSRREKP
jgi:tetratricopeptide (TPR) repeat protein